MTRRALCLPFAAALLNACDKLRGTGSAPAVGPDLTIGYSLLLDRQPPKFVSDKYEFQAGDRFRIRVLPSADAFVYLLNRGVNEQSYSFLFPNQRIAVKNPLAAEQTVTFPGATDWYTMDAQKGIENMVLIAGALEIPELSSGGQPLRREDLENLLAFLEHDRHPRRARTSEESEWTRVTASRENGACIVLRIPLVHR